MKYQIIADSGSTKTDWVIINDKDVYTRIVTKGLNPYLEQQKPFIDTEISTQLIPYINIDQSLIATIHFYGAGCSNEENRKLVNTLLSQHFPNSNIQVYHDMLGTVRSTLGDEAGVGAILGTGSNCCVYDGTAITQSLISLGYLAGDEGSGNHLGKYILKAYCYGYLPKPLMTAFQEKYQLSPEEIPPKLFSVQHPNALMASFSEFLYEHKSHPFIKKLVKGCFQDFVDRMLLSLDFPRTAPIAFIGSIAFYFQDFVAEVLSENGLFFKIALQKPIDGLVAYHSRS